MNLRSTILRSLTSGVASAALVVCTAAPGLTQTPAQTATPSLAELAKKEQERRKGVPGPQKVYTNKDLPEAPAPPPAAGAPAATPTPVGEPEPAGVQQKPAGEEKDEAWWRNRIRTARDELRRNEVFLEALQSRINALSADFVNRDDPYQRAKIGEDRQKALAQMDQLRKEIEEDTKRIEAIEDEARKAGVPPGWLR